MSMCDLPALSAAMGRVLDMELLHVRSPVVLEVVVVVVVTKMISESMQSPEFYIVQQVYCLTARKIQYKRPGVGVVVGAGSIHCAVH